MKVIDLLNKIANGENIPNKIKWKDELFDDDVAYFLYEYIGDCSNGDIKLKLNCNVDIIEEEPQEHKMPEKLDIREEKNIKNNWKWKVYGKEHSYNISTPQKIIADKINEIIDYLEELK